jgi:hypothetical protein
MSWMSLEAHCCPGLSASACSGAARAAFFALVQSSCRCCLHQSISRNKKMKKKQKTNSRIKNDRKKITGQEKQEKGRILISFELLSPPLVFSGQCLSVCLFACLFCFCFCFLILFCFCFCFCCCFFLWVNPAAHRTKTESAGRARDSSFFMAQPSPAAGGTLPRVSGAGRLCNIKKIIKKIIKK